MTDLYLVESDRFDVYYNQAIEKYLLDRVSADEVILYLWRNDRTVVIGKNQDACSEVHVESLNEDDGFLARRISGGGAVYHDKGNLNFTFLCKRDLFDIERQDQVILNALNDLGIHAEKSGRNDLLIDGKKFSGHAYYKGKENCFHHGTLMLEVNEDVLERYLNVSLSKLHSKNVKSVRSRIINLRSVKEDLDIDTLKNALIASFEQMYHNTVSAYPLNEDEIIKLRDDFACKEWIYGQSYDSYHMKERRFDWGTVRIFYDLEGDLIKDLKVYTDSMDHDLSEDIEKKLIGKRISELGNEENETGAILSLLKEENYEI